MGRNKLCRSCKKPVKGHLVINRRWMKLPRPQQTAQKPLLLPGLLQECVTIPRSTRKIKTLSLSRTPGHRPARFTAGWRRFKPLRPAAQIKEKTGGRRPGLRRVLGLTLLILTIVFYQHIGMRADHTAPLWRTSGPLLPALSKAISPVSTHKLLLLRDIIMPQLTILGLLCMKAAHHRWIPTLL